MQKHETASTPSAPWSAGNPLLPHDLPPPERLASLDQVDAAWIQQVFAHAGVQVPRVAMARAQAIGNGNTSETARVLLGYNADASKAPPSVVCKFHALDPVKMEAASLAGPYLCEANTYALFGDQPPLNVPRLYFASVSPDLREANLVFEDLSFCEPGDQLTGCGIPEAKAVVEQLAHLHKRFWKAPQLAGLDWLYKMNETAHIDGAKIFHERFTGVLTAEEFDIIDRFVPVISDWLKSQPQSPTLIHGDPRVDNIMFDRRDPAQVGAYVLDWQIARVGDAQADVAYFLSGSLSPEDRRACERELVTRHAAKIAEVDPSYTAERALSDYARNIVSGLHLTLLAGCVIASTPHSDKLLTTLARRNCAAVKDWR